MWISKRELYYATLSTLICPRDLAFCNARLLKLRGAPEASLRVTAFMCPLNRPVDQSYFSKCCFPFSVNGLICCLKFTITQIPEFSEELPTEMKLFFFFKESGDTEPVGSWFKQSPFCQNTQQRYQCIGMTVHICVLIPFNLEKEQIVRVKQLQTNFITMFLGPCAGLELVSTSQQPGRSVLGEAGILEQPVLFIWLIPFPFAVPVPNLVFVLQRKLTQPFWGERPGAKIGFSTLAEHF